MSSTYEDKFREIEEKWLKEWSDNNVYEFKENRENRKLYILDMFPYPSGAGLHVGHLKGYLATDVWARFAKMNGYTVFHPMGWDAFGLPAEQYAIKTGNSPASFTLANIDNFRRQLKSLMLSYDFKWEINTSDPNYYKHTQWIFSQMYKHGLAEIREIPVNWCEALNTVLSDEEIVVNEDGKRFSERGNHPVIYRRMKQWVLKITEYADELLKGLDNLDWPDNIKKIQSDWIGASSGYKFTFRLGKSKYYLKIKYASNIRKLQGVGIHQFSRLAKELNIDPVNKGNREFIDVQLLNELDRSLVDVCFIKDVDHRNTDELIPIFSDDEDKLFDENDEKLFLERYSLEPIRTYKLKDWVFSRQRYWGEPIPILFDKDGNTFLDKNLPVILPETVDYSSSRDGKSPLVNAKEWLKVGEYERETNTMPNWAGSSWYFIAYLLKKPDGTYHDIDSKEAKSILKRWLPVDVYIGGQEHAAMHLLYARFWHKFLHKLGLVNSAEPFKRLFNQGMILGKDGSKMSKSKGNAVVIDEILDEYSADSLRVYEAFSGPTQLSFVWEEDGVKTAFKWLNKVYRFFGELDQYENSFDDEEVNTFENRLIKKVSDSIPLLKINIGVSELMIFINEIQRTKKYHHKSLKSFVKILSLYAPALSEELWRVNLKEKTFLFDETWPILNELRDPINIEYKVFVNGKFRFMMTVPNHLLDASEDDEWIKENLFEEMSRQKGLKKMIRELNAEVEIKVNHSKRIFLTKVKVSEEHQN